MDIHNIFCVGRNFALHAKEMNNELPTSPMLFSKPTNALVETSGQPISLPSHAGSVHYETELVLHISKPYLEGMHVDELVDKMALGVDFTLRDVQSELKKKGHPWLLSKGFINSAAITKLIDFPGMEACKRTDFTLVKNGEEVQHGNSKDMIFNFQVLIDFVGKNFGLDKGDLIYTGTPAGVGPTESGDHFQLNWGNETLGEFTVSLK